MAATVKKNIWLWSTPGNINAPRERGLIAASQGILIPGAPMYLSTSGTWKAADTSDGTGDVIHGFFDGLVDVNATWPITAELAASTEIYVRRVVPGALYAVFVENGGSDAAAALANIGNSYGLNISTSTGSVGYTTLNVANANATVTVENVMSNLDPLEYTVSTSPGIALVRFLAAHSGEATKA